MTIYLVDDDAAACCAISAFLGTSGYSVKSFPSAEAFLEVADSAVEGIMLLDLRMTGMSGIELQSELPKRGIDLPIIFITGYGDVQTSVKAIKAGAIDFIEKPFSNDDLLASIREAFSRVNDCKKHTELRKCHASLTEREWEVLKHVVAGKSNRYIAELLRLSNRTIEVHRSRIMKKMEAESIPDLVQKYDICQKAGLL
jgi:two-component system response regulator FixJ